MLYLHGSQSGLSLRGRRGTPCIATWFLDGWIVIGWVPFAGQNVKALEAAPGEILAAQARCEIYQPFFANFGQQRAGSPQPND